MSERDKLIEISNEIKRTEKSIQGLKETKSKALNADVIKTLRAMTFIKIRDILNRKEMSRWLMVIKK